MKKDTYPDIRIEVLSEGLAKKILGKVEDAPPSVYGEEKPTSATIPDINAKGVNREMAKILETSNKKPNYTAIVKEAIQELRKDTTGSRQSFGDLTTGQMDPQTKKRPGTAFTRMTESGTDEYGSPDQFQVTPPKDADAGVQSTASKRRGIESQVASQTQNMVKEAIFELRKQPQDYGFAQPGGRTKGAGRKIRESIGSSSEQSKRLQSAPRIQEVERNVPQGGLAFKDEYGPVQERGVLGMPNIDEVSPGMPGAGGVPRIERRGSAVERSGLVMETEEAKAARQPAAKPKIDDFSTDYSMKPRSKDPGIDYGSITGMGAPTRAATSAEVAKREKGTKDGTDSIDPNTAEMFQDYDKVTGRSDIDEDALEGRSSSADLDADEMFQDYGKVGATEEVVEKKPPVKEKPSIEEVSDEVAETVTGFKPTKNRPAIPTTPETTENKRAGTPAPLLNSSGYFDAVLQIGELTADNATAEQKNTALKNYGVESLSEFLDLYKAQNPKSITAKPTGNVNGVNVSTPVVTGAGTMKTLEKTGKGLNKPKASGTPRKTRAKKINPKTVEAAVMKSERPAMDNTLSYIIKEAIEEFKLDKAALEKQKAPSTFSSKRQTYRG